MSDFIYDDLGVPNGKSDASVVPLPANQKVVSSEWNTVMQYLLDIQDWARNGKWRGLLPQSGNPAPAGINYYVWMNSSGQLMLTTPAGSFVVPSLATASFSWAGATLSIGEALTVTETWPTDAIVTASSIVQASYSLGLPAGVVLIGGAVTDDEVQATFINLTSSSQTLAAGTLRFLAQ